MTGEWLVTCRLTCRKGLASDGRWMQRSSASPDGVKAWILRQALKRTAPTGGADRSGQRIWDEEGGLPGGDAAVPVVTAMANSSKRVCSKR